MSEHPTHYAQTFTAPAQCGAVKSPSYPLLTTPRVSLVTCENCKHFLATVVELLDGFADYLPLYSEGQEIKSRQGEVLGQIASASLADWLCASANGYDALRAELVELREELQETKRQHECQLLDLSDEG